MDLSSAAPHITQGENKGARCCNFVAPHISPRVAEACQVSTPARAARCFNRPYTEKFSVRPLSSVITFENLLKALQHLFVMFFDDMIDQKRVKHRCHVRLLCYGVLWTVFEKGAYSMSESELGIDSFCPKSNSTWPFYASTWHFLTVCFCKTMSGQCRPRGVVCTS